MASKTTFACCLDRIGYANWMTNEELGMLFRKILQHENKIDEIELSAEFRLVRSQIQSTLDENNNKEEAGRKKMSEGWKNHSWNQYTKHTPKSKEESKREIRTDEQKEKFEAFRKLYPHYQSRSRRKDTQTHFFEKDYDELMFATKMAKWKVVMHPDEARFMPWSHRRVNNFTPLTDYQKRQALRELYRRHKTIWWDMKTRREEIQKDFPDADFSEFREELSKEKTEYAIWHLIHWIQ